MTNQYQPILPWENIPNDDESNFNPDDRHGRCYEMDKHLRFITDAALVSHRPLLLQGEPGSGKSSYAPFIARNLGWRYYEYNVTSRTEAQDMIWKFDALRRVRDANIHSMKSSLRSRNFRNLGAWNYVEPGPFWWAIDRSSALSLANRQRYSCGSTNVIEPFTEINAHRNKNAAVLLIDEIDKADPNVPNDLLEILSMQRFRVDDAGIDIARPRGAVGDDRRIGTLLVVITTNDERDLPPAFLRRCIAYTITEPNNDIDKIDRFINIARLHMSSLINTNPNGELNVRRIAEKCVAMRKVTSARGRRSPSTAEFLDVVRFCLVRSIDPEGPLWDSIAPSILVK